MFYDLVQLNLISNLLRLSEVKTFSHLLTKASQLTAIMAHNFYLHYQTAISFSALKYFYIPEQGVSQQKPS